MALPTVQYRRHRVAYSVAAVMGFLAAFQGGYWLVTGSVASFFGWLFLLAGLTAVTGCSWMAIRNSPVLELNQEGVVYKGDTFSWSSLRSYGIRKEIGESSLFVYLILTFADGRAPLEIQLDWLDNSESIPDQMAVYAASFQIQFEGTERKEV